MLGQEAVAWARQGQLIFLSKSRPAPRVEGERVVVFVHGYGAAGKVFAPMRDHVEAKLSLPTFEFTYRSMSSFDRITGDLAATLDELGARGNRIDLVGHSLGGLLSRWYIQEMGGAAHVDRLVTLATPHAGTASAKIAPGPLRHVLMPNSAIVRRLKAGRERAARIVHTAFVAGADLMVSPPASAAAIDDADVRWFEELGHNALLFDEQVHDAVVSALSGSE